MAELRAAAGERVGQAELDRMRAAGQRKRARAPLARAVPLLVAGGISELHGAAGRLAATLPEGRALFPGGARRVADEFPDRHPKK